MTFCTVTMTRKCAEQGHITLHIVVYSATKKGKGQQDVGNIKGGKTTGDKEREVAL